MERTRNGMDIAPDAIYGVDIATGTVDRLERLPDNSFVASCGDLRWHAHTALLATGVVDVEPDLPDVKHAVAAGCVRYCPACDGFEAIGKKVAVIGRGNGGLGEALFVKHFAAEVTLFTLDETIRLQGKERSRLNATHVRVEQEAVMRRRWKMKARCASICAMAWNIASTSSMLRSVR